MQTDFNHYTQIFFANFGSKESTTTIIRMKKILRLFNTFLIILCAYGLSAQGAVVILDYHKGSVCAGQQVCASVKTLAFDISVTDIELGFSWNPEVLSFAAVQPSGIAAPFEWSFEDHFTATSNELSFDWQSETPVELPLNVFLFDICWEVSADYTNQIAELELEFTEANFLDGNNAHDVGYVTNIYPISVLPPSIRFESQFITNDVSSVCVPVVTFSFHEATAVDFTIDWDADFLAFQSIKLDNSEFDGLTVDDFSLLSDEQLNVSWNALNANPLDLDLINGGIGGTRAFMYEVCFDVINNSSGFSSPINLVMDETDKPTIMTSCSTLDISTVNEGRVQLVGDGMSIEFPDSTISANTTDICIPTYANNLEEIVSFQFSMLWDEEVLEFNSVKLDESVLPQISTANFGTDTPGELRVSWLDPNVLGYEINDGDILFETCFDVIGQIGDETQIFLGGDSLGIGTEILSPQLDILPVLDVPGTIRIRGEGRFVLPGDANEDKEANHFDLLHVGLGYNAIGTERANTNIEWERKYSRNWGEASPISLVNYKHSDTNGDSQVNMDDVQAIVQNWGEMIDVAGNMYEPDDYIGEAILTIEETTANPEQEILELPILLGTNDMSTEQAYGIAFSISYDYEGDIPDTDWISVEAQDSWLGTLGEDLVSIQRHFPEQQRLDIALTRLDRISRDGSGQIAQLSIVVEDILLLMTQPQDKSKMLDFTIHDIRLINENEEAIEVQDRQINIEMDTSTGLMTLADSAITVFPSITRNRLHLVSDETIEQAIILNLGGMQIDVIEHPQATLDVKGLDSGMYLLHLITEEGISVKRFTVQ